ncbi:PREDICTED: uncharacterized protein LOC101308624 [Fragaria vesca subsp. vesca]
MDIPDMTLREIVQSNPVSNTEPNSGKDGHKTSKKWFGLETLKTAVGKLVLEILDPNKGPILEKWNVIFVISCLFAVLTDPLFLYVPLINQDVKCIRLDNKLKIAAVIFRSITDFVYTVKIIFQINELKKVTVMAIWRSYILLDIIAILPIPQYVPRLLRIYLACKEIKNSPKGKLGLWIKGGLNFLMYIFSGHMFGGFWYFFSVQRMMDCWQYACRDADGCKPSTFSCQDHPTTNMIKLLNDSCPISPSNATIFDFGIFLNALQSGLVGSTDYSRKLSNCFWWGLRNLSSLGSNLQPSVNTWENLFAAVTSIVGLLLFLYLLGNLQMYMQVESASKEQLRWKTELESMMRTERKTRIERSKGPEVEQWLTKNGLPMRFMPEIMEKVVQVDLEQNRDVNVDNILSILPLQLQRDILFFEEKLEQGGGKIELWLSENHLPMRLKTEILEALRQRPEFEQNGVGDMNTALSILPSQLKTYIESYMQKVREIDEKTDMWLSENELPADHFKSDVMEAILLTLEENKDLDAAENIILPASLPVPLEERVREYKWLVRIGKKIEEKGEEIDLWMLKNGIPKSHKSDIEEAVRVELKKDEDIDVETFISIYPTTAKIQEFLPFNRLKKLKLLEALDERVLKAICEHLKPVEYGSSSYIIQEGQPLEVILFVEGTVFFEKKRNGCSLYAPLVWGEELLVWPSSTSFPAEVPIATDTLETGWYWFHGTTNALVLTATDMESIGSIFRPQFDLLTSHWLTRLKKVSKLQCMDEEVLKAIFLHLKQDLNPLYSYVENQPVASMTFIVEGSVKFTRKDNDCEELVRCDGEVYGEEILDWVLDTSFPTLTPFATHTAIHDHDNAAVELSITAEELKSVGSKFRSYFSTFQKESQPDLLTVVGLTVLKRVPKLKTMTEEVLEAISRQLQFRNSNGYEHIIPPGEPVDRMLFVLRGNLQLYSKDDDYQEEERFFGEDLIDWLARSSDGTRPSSNYDKVTTALSKQTQLLVLMADDLESVVSEYKSHFS